MLQNFLQDRDFKYEENISNIGIILDQKQKEISLKTILYSCVSKYYCILIQLNDKRKKYRFYYRRS